MHVFSQMQKRKRLALLSDLEVFVTDRGCKKRSNTIKYGCMKCNSPFCMQLSPSKILIPEIEEFSYDKNINVCPVNAISWNYCDEIPNIAANTCVHCGLCCLSCPLYAINFSSGKIRTNLHHDQRLVDYTKSNMIIQNSQLSYLKKVNENSALCESDTLLDIAQKSIERVGEQYRNLLVRNILIGLGMNAMTSRIGDASNRIDVIFADKGKFGVTEVEFGSDTLSAARGVLEDIAVMFYKYKIPKSMIGAWVVLLNLPNKRQDYWNVIKDIRNVLGIKVNTITIGALLILLWNRCVLDPLDNSFYIDYDNVSIRKAVEQKLQRKLYLKDEHLGIFEPLK